MTQDELVDLAVRIGCDQVTDDLIYVTPAQLMQLAQAYSGNSYSLGKKVMVRAFDLLEDNEWHAAEVVEIDHYPGVSPYGCKVEGFGERLFHFDPSEMKLHKQEGATT